MTCMYYIYPKTPEDEPMCSVGPLRPVNPYEDCANCDLNGYTQEDFLADKGDRKYHEVVEEA